MSDIFEIEGRRFGIIAGQIRATNRNSRTKKRVLHTLSPKKDQDEKQFSLHGALYIDSLSDHTLVLWSVKANTLDKAATPPQDQKRLRAVVLRLTATARFFKVLISAGHTTLCQSYSPHISRSLANRRLPATAAESPDALLSHHPIQSGANKRKENKNVRHTNKRRGS